MKKFFLYLCFILLFQQLSYTKNFDTNYFLTLASKKNFSLLKKELQKISNLPDEKKFLFYYLQGYSYFHNLQLEKARKYFKKALKNILKLPDKDNIFMENTIYYYILTLFFSGEEKNFLKKEISTYLPFIHNIHIKKVFLFIIQKEEG